MALLDINSLLSNTDITNIASNPSPFGLGLLGNELIDTTSNLTIDNASDLSTNSNPPIFQGGGASIPDFSGPQWEDYSIGYQNPLENSLFQIGIASPTGGGGAPTVGEAFYADLNLNPGPQFDLGLDSTLHTDALLEQYSHFQDFSPQETYSTGPSNLDLNSGFESLGNANLFHGINNPGLYQGLTQGDPGQDLHVFLLENQYNYSHGTTAPWISQGNSGPGEQDLNSTFATNTNPGIGNALNYFGYVTPTAEALQDPSNPIFDTIHEQYLQANQQLSPSFEGQQSESTLLHLQGQAGFFQGTTNARDVVGRNSLNAVPGGITPSQYADLNNNDVNTVPPDGAPVPNNLLFHGIKDPSIGQGKKIGGVDLHEYLLDSGVTSYHTYNSITGLFPTQLDINIPNFRGNEPTKYEDRMRLQIEGETT